MTNTSEQPHRFQSFFCWKGDQIQNHNLCAVQILMFQSFFCWKGHQISILQEILVNTCVSILFLLEGASNLINARLLSRGQRRVSILFLLEGASNPLVGWRKCAGFSWFQSFFCWKGHQILQTSDGKIVASLFQSFFCWKGHQILLLHSNAKIRC